MVLYPNKLPESERVCFGICNLSKLAKLQHHSLKVSIQANYQPAILEDFLSLGYTPKEFVLMNEEEFLEVYRRTFGPMHQIALNMGFETWKY